jgi:hypothetical protein
MIKNKISKASDADDKNKISKAFDADDKIRS